jgi:hypothetical protein
MATFCGYLLGEGSDKGDCFAIIAFEAATSIVVLVWCAANWSLLRPALLRSVPLRFLLVAALTSVGTFLLAHFFVNGLVHVFDIPAVNYSGAVLSAGYGWWAVFGIFCIQPAIIEELAFRGVILGGMEKVLGGRDAVLVSSLMFMIIHLSILSFPHLLIIGLVIGFFRLRTGSIYPGMVLHLFHNSLVILQEANII